MHGGRLLRLLIVRLLFWQRLRHLCVALQDDLSRLLLLVLTGLIWLLSFLQL
jgi:hypothetical protein